MRLIIEGKNNGKKIVGRKRLECMIRLPKNVGCGGYTKIIGELHQKHQKTDDLKKRKNIY